MKILLWYLYLRAYYTFNFWGAVIAAGASLLGGAMANKSNAKQADTDREWQRENAQNAHQWQTEDMRAAGLNPILSATGGAGAKPSGGSSLGAQSDAITPAVNSALAARRQSTELELMKANEVNTVKDTQKKDSEIALNKEAEKTQLYQQYNLDADAALKAHQGAREASQNAINHQVEKSEVERQKLYKAQAEQARQSAALTSHSARSAQVEADMDTHEMGKRLKWTNRTTEAAEGVSSAARGALNPFHGPAPRKSRGR